MDHWQNTEQREDKYGDHGGDHQQYLKQKRRKLDEQRRRSAGNNWFAGCVVWIDGLTDPPADDLGRLVLEGGGFFCTTFESRATHVVAANMTAAQTKKMKARKRGFAKPAVFPAWVVDSAARRCKLDPGPYLLWRTSGPTDEALAVVRARNNLRKAGFGSEVVEDVVEEESSVSSVEQAPEEEYVRGPSLLGRVEAWVVLGPAVAMFLGRADPANRATVLLLLELASELVERSRLEDVVSLMSLLEEHATANPPWRKAARLLFDLVSFCVKERYGSELAALRARPDWAFLGTPSQ